MDTKAKSLKEILDTVNSKYINNSSNTVNSNEPISEKICRFIENENINPEGVAMLLTDLLDDRKSLSYYLLLAKEHNSGVLIDLAYQTRERYKLGLLQKSKPIYFIGALRKLGYKTKFRE